MNTTNSILGKDWKRGRKTFGLRGWLARAAAGVLLVALFAPASVRACAACYGQSDSPLAVGMNWGILSLLGMILMVLGGFGAFFVFLAKRSASMAAGSAAKQAGEAAGSQSELATAMESN
jgi:hypothetical protein